MMITHYKIGHPKRYPSYPTNNTVPTRHLVKLDHEKIWRRVYQDISTYDSSTKTVKCFVNVKQERVYLENLDLEKIGYSIENAQSRKDCVFFPPDEDED